MAEGAEETESNSNADTPAMLGTVLPCEAITASLCGMKREFDSICVQPSPPVPHTALAAAAAASAVRATKSPSPSSSSSGNVQQHPINLKSEECEKEFVAHKARSTSPNAALTEQEKEQQRSEYYKSISNNNGRLSPHEQAKVAAATAAAQAHLNGTMQDMINLQKLQNLASMQQQHQQHQQQQQQHSSVPGALAGLQGLGGISSAAALNSPLNLSVGSTSTLSSTSTKPPASGALGGSGGGIAGCSPPGGSQMPQLILASGQLVQGVQGAQLLIPTSQGIAVQTILTIPVTQQINTNEQFLQSYAALSSGAVAFNNSTLGPHALPMQQQAAANLLKPNFFSPGVQQLLAALHPDLFPGPHHQPEVLHPLQQQQQGSDTKTQHMQQVLKQQSSQQQNLGSLHRTESMSPKLDNPQTSIHLRDSSSPSQGAPPHLRASPLSALSGGQHPNPSPTRSSNLTGLGLNLSQEKPASAPTPPSTGCYNSPSGSQVFRSHSPNSLITSSSHSLSSQVNTPPSAVCVLSSINRLTSANGELTITKSHGPPNNSTSTSSSSPSPGSTAAHQQIQPMKLSPTTMQISPTGTETSTTDLLVDSPNEPTINQTNCNVVDGIDLDEIKEFAKAFKLRRLSLGLTQTQVGQALSVTEGPAYSQSAICSALAAQMYAAQLSSQQQNMFEKLDITPKSAQKIKPVLERWMKEAEESHWNRYKAGQNHLTDFIGVEPSKKRKRRTSFTPQALELLNAHFERNTHPSGTEITGLAHQLGYEREVIRIWFCNKRQALKNTVRMMSKGMV